MFYFYNSLLIPQQGKYRLLPDRHIKEKTYKYQNIIIQSDTAHSID